MKSNILEKALSDTGTRLALVKESHQAFCTYYFPHYITYQYAFFHKEMFKVTENSKKKLNVFMAFRGSGKSTILNLSNTLWSVIGKRKKKFILIISKTKVQSQSHFENIKTELESNLLLKRDFGPFKIKTGEWGNYSIELPKYDAKIMCIGSLQNIRGLRYKSQRPDLIICDDLEDIISVKEKKNKDKLFTWFTEEVMSIGEEDTDIYVLGNLLSDDCLMVDLNKLIKHNKQLGDYYSYPLLDDNNKITWPQRYSVEQVLEIERNLPKKKRYDLFSVFDREYRLNISYVKTGEEEIQKPITLGGNKKEDFKISVPLWAVGICIKDKLIPDNLTDPDGWIETE